MVECGDIFRLHPSLSGEAGRKEGTTYLDITPESTIAKR